MAKCIQPSYVKKFKCDGKFCDCRCCRDWQILVDDDAHKKFFELDEQSRAEIFQNISVKNLSDGVELRTCNLRDDGRCSFLDDDGLCRIQKNFGEDFLAAICQSFPRVTYQLDENIFLQSMTLTCPVAAQIILLPFEPMKFVEVDGVTARAVIRLKNKSPDSVGNFLQLQRMAIGILQDRTFTINQRLKILYGTFGGELSDENIFDAELHATTIIDIVSKVYGMNFDEKKISELHRITMNYREKILHDVQENFPNVLENYLVNEFFLRCYPYSFNGDEKHNCRIFIAGYRLLEFALTLSVVAKKKMTVGEMVTLIISVNDTLDHNRGGMDALIDFASSCDEKKFAVTMLEN